VSTEPAATPGTPPAPGDQPNWAAFNRLAVVAAVVGWVLYVLAGIANLGTAETPEDKAAATGRFMVGYLSGFVFWASLPLGAMALLMIRYLTKTSWGLLLTRPFEAATRTLPLTVLLFVPLVVAVYAGNLSPYWWTAPEKAETTDPSPAKAGPPEKRDVVIAKGMEHHNDVIRDLRRERREKLEGAVQIAHRDEEREIHAGQNHFLTPDAYLGVGAVLFAIWGVMIFFLNKWGKEATDPDPRVVDDRLERLKNMAGPGLIVYAITTTAAASQWVMSTEPGWSSTMFPVIYAVNQFLTCFAFCLALFLLFAARPPFAGHMRPKFQLDMGTLMLAFTLFWSYTSFSQYMLVWIGNLPEEIPFFLKRSNYNNNPSGWWYVSAALIALHFALPFLLLLFRNIKLHPTRLRLVATYLVVLCMVDVIWWIAPSAKPTNFPAWLLDAGATLGVGGVWGLYFIYQLRQRPLFPDNQAFLLPEGHHHEQH
jgi:hypothetical protein